MAVALRTPVNEAEKIKKKHGCGMTSMVPEEDSIEVPSVGGRKPRIMARQVLGDVIQARAEEVCQMILTEIRRAGFDRSLNSGVVLTGGGALIKNLDVLLREETGLPVMVSDDPISAVVLGSGKTLDHIELLKEVTIG